MTSWTCSIIKSATDNGLFSLDPNGHYKLGDSLDVDIDSRRMETYEGADGQPVQMEIVYAYDTSPNKIAWPVSILDL